MLRIQDVIIDPRSLGGKFWLTEVSPVHAYQNGQRTDTISGYRYNIALPEKGLEKVGVKIEGVQQMAAPESGFVEVKFEGLELYVYFSNGQPVVAAKATGISLVNPKS